MWSGGRACSKAVIRPAWVYDRRCFRSVSAEWASDSMRTERTKCFDKKIWSYKTDWIFEKPPPPHPFWRRKVRAARTASVESSIVRTYFKSEHMKKRLSHARPRNSWRFRSRSERQLGTVNPLLNIRLLRNTASVPKAWARYVAQIGLLAAKEGAGRFLWIQAVHLFLRRIKRCK